jgi:hypothetical protein
MKELTTQGEITQAEIDAIKAKHVSIIRKMRKAFIEALEMGDWFLTVPKRLGIKKGGHTGQFTQWLQVHFSEQMSLSSIWQYMRLARNREFLETKFAIKTSDSEVLEEVPTILAADAAIAERNAEERAARADKKSKTIDIESETHSANGEKSAADVAVVTRQFSPEEHEAMSSAKDYSEIQAIKNKDRKPIDILSDKLKQYAALLWQLQASEADVREYMEAGEFETEEIKRRIHLWWDDQPLILKMMVRTFIR